MTANTDQPPLPERTRAQVARDVVHFQLKLFLDGLRDVLLFPASIILGIAGIVFSRHPGEPFYRLLRAGKASEQWLDLFGEAYVSPDDQPVDHRRSQNWQELEQQLRELDTSLRDSDYAGAARDGAARIRQSIKKYLDNR